MLTRKQICNEVKQQLGINVELYKGDGYYYFVGDEISLAETTSVLTNSLNTLTMETWLFEVRNMLENHQSVAPVDS